MSCRFFGVQIIIIYLWYRYFTLRFKTLCYLVRNTQTVQKIWISIAATYFRNFSPEVHACTQTSLSCRPRHRPSPILTRIRNVIFRVFALILRRRRVQASKYTCTALYNTYSEAVANCNSIGKHSFRVENSRWGSQRVYINIIYRCYAPVFVCVQSTWQHNICDVASYTGCMFAKTFFRKIYGCFWKLKSHTYPCIHDGIPFTGLSVEVPWYLCVHLEEAKFVKYLLRCFLTVPFS